MRLKIKLRSKDEGFSLGTINDLDYSEFYEYPDGDVVDSYWLEKPFSKALIVKKFGDLQYHVLEPKLSVEEYIALENIHRELRERIVLKPEDVSDKEKVLFREFVSLVKKYGFSEISVGKMWYYISRNFLGYERVHPLLNDPYIEDISCNGYALPIYVFHKSYGSLPTNIYFDAEELDHFVLKLSQKANSQISLEKPLVDASLPTGERVQITYRNVVSSRGSSFTIRKFSEEPITPLDLISWKTIDAEVMAFLWFAVESRKSMLIIGGTACGKTTMLNAISFFIPYNSKIVSLEDTREIQLPHENWLPLLTREVEGRGRVEMFDLLRAALRQRPEYILVGEIRGREAITLFQAMNTGHTTYSTLHAGDVDAAINRLIHEPINVPPAMFESLDLVMTLRLEYYGGRAVRKMLALDEISINTRINHKPLYKWNRVKDAFLPTENLAESRVMKEIGDLHGMNREEVMIEIKRRAEYLKDLASDRPYSMVELIEKINSYRREFYG